MLLESDFATSKASPDTDKDSGCYYCSSVEEDVHAVPWFAALPWTHFDEQFVSKVLQQGCLTYQN